MERYFIILFSYLLLFPAVLLCYAPVREHIRFGLRKMILLSAIFFAAVVPLCALIEYRFFVFTRPVFLPSMLIFLILYHKTVSIDLSKALTVFSIVSVWLSYLCDFAIMIDSRLRSDGQPRNDNLTLSVIELLLTLVFSAFAYYPLRKFGGELISTFHDRRVWYTAVAVSCIFILISRFLMPLQYETLYVNHVYRSFTISVTSTFLLHLLLCVIFYFIISGMIQTQKVEAQNRFYELRESHYLKQQRYIEENARVRHDFKHTIRTLRQLADQENYTALKSFIDQYYDMLPENDAVSFCKNPAINALLNYYYQLAVQAGIDTKWSIDIPEASLFRNVDLCNIIGNILDNAITACGKLPVDKRWIQLAITLRHNTNLYIVATNSFDGNVRLHNDRYLSTSHDGNGIGLSSVESIAETYNGAASFSHNDTEFFTNVVLSLEGK
ncbi:MAG: GHKL domain-containing protein [Lachnospiraceae bacterium]|nr:GHKL domain-containing protein [Lachnospiraceae bacterium]